MKSFLKSSSSVFVFAISLLVASLSLVYAGDPSVPSSNTGNGSYGTWNWTGVIQADGSIGDIRIGNWHPGGNIEDSKGGDNSGTQVNPCPANDPKSNSPFGTRSNAFNTELSPNTQLAQVRSFGTPSNPSQTANNPCGNPPPPACSVTLDNPVIEAGEDTVVTLSWTPNPKGAVSLRRRGLSPLPTNQTTLTVPDKATTFSETLNLPIGKYRYNLSYVKASTTKTHTCHIDLEVKDVVTECSDGKDNTDAEDTLGDKADPGCYVGGDPTKPNDYRPLDDSESNDPPDLKPLLDIPSTGKVGTKVKYIPGAHNDSSTYAGQSSFVFGWRKTTDAPLTLNGTRFEAEGHVYQRVASVPHEYIANDTYSPTERSFTPQTEGIYEVCVVADYPDAVQEGAAGENNNERCEEVTVGTGPVVDLFIKKTGTNTWVRSLTIERDDTLSIRWEPAGATYCQSTDLTEFSITNTNGSAGTSNTVAEPTSGSRIYQVTCENAAGLTASAQAVVTVNDPNPLTLTATPSIVRREETSDLTWSLGGRTGCTLQRRGDTTSTPVSTETGTLPSIPIRGETLYTLSCADGDSTTATIKMLPVISET